MSKHVHVYMGARGGGKAYTRLDGSLTPLGQRVLDADFKESNVKRDEGGKFSAQQHQAAASQHSSVAAKHPDKQVAKAHADAAQAHTLAAQHMAAQTGWQEHNSQKAHNATKAAHEAEAAAGGAANADQLKAVASDPSKPLSVRADAVKQLEGMQQQADVVAASPLAVPQPAPAPAAHATSQFNVANISPEMKAKLAKLAPAIKAQQEGGFAHSPGVKPLEGMAPQAKGNEVGSNPGLHAKTPSPIVDVNKIPKDVLEKARKANAKRTQAALGATHPSKNVGPTKGSTLGPDMPGFKIPPKPEYAPPKASYSANVTPPELAGKKLSYAALKKAFQSGKRINMKAK